MTRRMGAIAAVALLPLFAPACAPEPGPRNLLFVTLDTTRRDHLPLYGYTRDTAPRLTELSRDAIVYDEAYSQETNTTPSHASMFTGVYPHQHGAIDNGVPLPEGRPTLAEILRRAGFRTAAFVSAAPLKAKASGLDRGFERFDDAFAEAVRDDRATASAATRWISERGASERWFCFLHLYGAHGPYLPPPGYRSLFRSTDPGPEIRDIPPYQVIADAEGKPLTHLNDYVDLYDGEIRAVDDVLKAVLAKVDLSHTVVVVLADHGEVLGGRYHPFDHGGEVWEETTRIPLVLHVPGIPASRVAEPVETIDLIPTLAAALGVGDPAATAGPGRNALPVPGAPARDPHRPVFSAARASKARHADRGYDIDPLRRIRSVRQDAFKLILYPGISGDYVELYDLAGDPGETSNCYATRTAQARTLLEGLEAFEGRGAAGAAPPVIDPETLEQLRSLGYVGK